MDGLVYTILLTSSSAFREIVTFSQNSRCLFVKLGVHHDGYHWLIKNVLKDPCLKTRPRVPDFKCNIPQDQHFVKIWPDTSCIVSLPCLQQDVSYLPWLGTWVFDVGTHIHLNLTHALVVPFPWSPIYHWNIILLSCVKCIYCLGHWHHILLKNRSAWCDW